MGQNLVSLNDALSGLAPQKPEKNHIHERANCGNLLISHQGTFGKYALMLLVIFLTASPIISNLRMTAMLHILSIMNYWYSGILDMGLNRMT